MAALRGLAPVLEAVFFGPCSGDTPRIGLRKPGGLPMRCSKCESENPAGLKFCGNCATPLKNRCAKCGSENPPTFKFCGECAASLHDDAITKGKAAAAKFPAAVRVIAENFSPTLEGERKTVTALFADLKGSTELMHDLDSEEVSAIMNPALRIMVDAVRRYDGY